MRFWPSVMSQLFSCVLLILMVFPGKVFPQTQNTLPVKEPRLLLKSKALNNQNLPLSLMDTIEQTLKNNVQITVLGYQSKVNAQKVIEEESVFDPSVSVDFTADERANQVSSAFASPDVTENRNLNWNLGLEQKLPLGLEYDISFDNTRNETNSLFAGLNPQYNSELELSMTQPLLKNFGVDVNRTNLYISKNNVTISDLDFAKEVIDIISEAETIYWDLVFSIEDLRVKEKSLDRARDLERQVKAQVDVGTMAPLEILQAKSEVASREEFVIVAKDLIQDNEDNLKNVLNIGFDSPDGRKKIKPLDRPKIYNQFQMSNDEAVKEALTLRPDYLAKKMELENKNIEIKFNQNQLYPSLDLVATLGLNGIAGDAQSISTFGGTPGQSRFGGDYGDTLGNLFDTEYYQWEVGLKLKYPIGNRSAKSRLTSSRLESEKLLFDLKDIEKNIVVEVREALRQLKTDLKRIEAARAARKFAEEKLKAEEKKFKVGLSTSFNVLEFQEDLAEEQSNEIKAIIDFNKSIIRTRQVMASTLKDHNIELSTRSIK